MQNNPIRYTDPTGHKIVEEYGNGNCSTSGYCSGGSTYTPPSNGGGENWCSTHAWVCGGDTPDDVDEILGGDKEIMAEEQLQYCLAHRFAPECDIPQQATLTPLPYEYDFIGFWEFDHLDAWGFRLNFTFCRIVCGDFSFDILGNRMLREATSFFTLSGVSTALGWGYDGSIGIVGAYDAPTMDSLAGAGRNIFANIVPGIGGQVSYGSSESPNVSRNYAQTWSLGISTGQEYSGGMSPGYSIPIFTLDEKNFYKGLKVK